MRAFDAALNVPWAIQQESLQAILDIAARVHAADIEAAMRIAAERNAEINGISAVPGKKRQGTTMTMRGSVAVLPLEGPIFRYSNLFADISGAASLEMLSLDLNDALKDKDVSAILMHVDSPGGEVNGTAEFADMIYKARGLKPIIAYVSHQGASAAYWIASAADRIICAQTSMIGSIGAIIAVPNPAADGKRSIEFVSSQSPNKRPDPTTKTGKDQIQSIVDDIAAEFITTVARNRGVTSDEVVGNYGAGGIMIGQHAVDAGLADAVGSFEDTLSLIQQDKLPEKHARPATSTTKANESASTIDLATSDNSDTTDTTTTDAPTPDDSRPFSGDVTTSASKTEKSDESMTSWKERAIAALSGIKDDGDEVAEPVTSGPLTPPASRDPHTSLQDSRTSDAEIARLREQLSAEQQANRTMLAERIAERASNWAKEVIEINKQAYAVEREQLIAMYVQAATDDHVMGQSIRVEQLAKTYAVRPKHMMDEETIAAGLQNLTALANISKTEPTTQDGKPMTPERRAALLEHTEVGKMVLADNSRNGRN